MENDLPDKAVMESAMHEKPVDMNERIIRFFRKRPEVVAVYLFGSQAREQATEGSDVHAVFAYENQSVQRHSPRIRM